MNPILSMIERMRARPDVGVVDQEQSWKIVIPKGGTYICEVTVPHTVLEWFASVRARAENKEAWSDWSDYEGYDDTPKSDLENSMAADVERFVDRVSKGPLTLPLSIDGPEEDAEQPAHGDAEESV
jgi:hypothetical protein